MGLYDLLKKIKKETNVTVEKVQENNTEVKVELSDKEKIIERLPKFKYHPNLYTNNIVTFAKGTCQCCNKEVDAYVETMYTAEDVDCICLHCIADGSAAKKFNGTFIQDYVIINNPAAVEELEKRTPGYVSWQGENWLACCNDYCEFIGDVGTKELNAMGIAEEVFDEYEANYEYDDFQWVKDHLTAAGSVAGYLFKCRKCGKYHLNVDMS